MTFHVHLLVTSALVIVSQQLVLLPSAVAADSNTSAPSPPVPAAPRSGCPSMCGDVEIPYPFGIGDDCSWKGEFTLTCNHSFSPPRPYVFNMEVIDINLESGEGRVYSPVSSICYNSSNTTTTYASWTLGFTGTPLLISSTRNEFTAIGCSTVAYMGGKEDWSFFTGCISTCVSLHDAADDGAVCTGLGCCQTDIPTNISVIEISWSIGNDTPIDNPGWRYNPCSYAFVAEKGW